MSEDKRANPYPFPTAAEVEAAPGDRATKAARNIATRYIDGIPKRAFLLGEYDNAPIMRGIRDLTMAIYAYLNAHSEDQTQKALAQIDSLLEDHRCPD